MRCLTIVTKRHNICLNHAAFIVREILPKVNKSSMNTLKVSFWMLLSSIVSTSRGDASVWSNYNSKGE